VGGTDDRLRDESPDSSAAFDARDESTVNPESAIDHASGPETRTIPRWPGPGGLATAAIVSSGSKWLTRGGDLEDRLRMNADTR
jgi:hypothetical protein